MAIDKVTGKAWADLSEINNVAKADIAKVAGVEAPSSGSGIVTDNLYQYYDASDSSSYSGSGTTWTDLQGNYDLTLIGGPVYSSTQPAHFDFDFVNDRARGATNYAASSNDMSVEVWFRADSLLLYRYSLVAALEQTSTNRRFLLNIESNNTLRWIPYNPSGAGMGTLLTTDTVAANTWYHVCGTKSGTTSTIYINGSSSASMTLSGSTLGTCDVFGVAERQLTSLDLFNGDISKVRVYSDALTASEVLQNYNAEKTYYGHS